MNFETFVVELLRVHATSQGKPFEIQPSAFDAVAPLGFDNFTGPVFIECHASTSQARFRNRLQKALSFIALNATKSGAYEGHRNLTFINVFDSALAPSLSYKNELVSKLHELGLTILIWTWKELNELVSQHQLAAKGIEENLLPLRVRQISNSADNDWTTTRTSRLSALVERISIGRNTLFLGAGVSASAGMPDWNSLLNALFVAYLANVEEGGDVTDDDKLKLVQRMNELDAPSALVSARYVRKALAESKASSNTFVEAIRKALYGLRRGRHDGLSTLIESLVAMCVPRRSGTLVKSVITYNFDDLFERGLNAGGVQHKCIYLASEPPDIDDLPVYHVHGFVPQDASTYAGVNETPLVFSEEGYHHIYAESYHWSNLAQLNALQNSTCIMVGLSMSDPNLRRLLEIAQRGFTESRHFAFLRRTSLGRFRGDGVNTLDVAEEKTTTFLKRHHATTEALMSELGVTVIWFEEFDELPALLESVFTPSRLSAASAAY